MEKPKSRRKKVPPERREHIVQIPLMNGCMLCLQLNQLGIRWTIGFPRDKVAYPIDPEIATTLATLASKHVHAGWSRRVMDDGEVEYLKELFEESDKVDSTSEIPPIMKDEDLPPNVMRFVQDIGKVWAEQQPAVMDIVTKLNDTVNGCQVPILTTILSLAVTTMMGAATVGASGAHLASLFLKLAEVCSFHVERVPIPPQTSGSN